MLTAAISRPSNNAGIMDVPPAVSVDGFETHFAVNHLAHAMLIQELMPVLSKTADENPSSSDVRIVSVASEGWALHPKGGFDFDTIRSAQDKWSEVAVSRYGYVVLSLLGLLGLLSVSCHQIVLFSKSSAIRVSEFTLTAVLQQTKQACQHHVRL